VFSDDSLNSIADKALERATGARGLRSILEEILLEVQFELPSRGDVTKCVVTKETVERNVNIIQQLINELTDPNDIGQVAAMILRLSSEYLDRGALFVTTNEAFLGLSGFGTTGDGGSIEDRMPLIQIERHSPSILEEVTASRHPHRGKLKRTDANARLLQELGSVLPTEVVALPILHDEQSVGILYGDNAEHRAPIDGTTGLEIFLSQAGYAFGNAVLAWQRSDERGRGGS